MGDSVSPRRSQRNRHTAEETNPPPRSEDEDMHSADEVLEQEEDNPAGDEALEAIINAARTDAIDALFNNEDEDDEEDLDYIGQAASDGEGSDNDDDASEEESIEYEGVERDDSDNESDDYDEGFFGQVSRHVYARWLSEMPLLREYSPPPLEHDLADELLMRTAAAGPRTPLPGQRRVLSPTESLFLRETCPGDGTARAGTHISAHHRLPTRPTGVVDRMHSRGYIGQFAPDGEIFIAAFQNERRIRMYSVQSGWRICKDVHARNLRWTVTDTALSSDNRYLLYSSITPTVHLVNVDHGTGGTGTTESIANVTDIHEALQFSTEDARANAIWSLSWSADNAEIIAGTGDASLYIYDLAAGRTVVRVRAHKDDVNAIAYADESGNLIFTGSDDHTVKAWDRRTLGAKRANPVGVFIGHTEGVAHLDSKNDGRYFISNGKDQAIKLWDVRAMKSAREAGDVLGADVPSFHWDYRWMSYPAAGRVVQHPRDGSISTFRGHQVLSTLCRAYWSPAHTTGQRYLYAGSADGGVHIWDVVTGREVAILKYHTEVVRDCSWHPYLPLIASVSFDGTVCTYEPEAMTGGAEEEEEEKVKKDKETKGDDKWRRTRGGGGLPAPGTDQLRDWL